MKIIIVGCGKVGTKIAEQLSQEGGHDITVIDPRRKVVESLINQHDILGIVGSSPDIATFDEARVSEADILIAVTGSDELNLLTCLIAKKYGDCQTIARVRKREYVKALHLFKDDLGLAMVINPEQAAAFEIARILKFPTAVQIDTFAKGRAEILKFKIPESSPLNNISIAHMSQQIDSGILVCGVERGDKAFIPGGDFILKSGDYINIVTSVKGCVDFFKKIGIKTNRVILMVIGSCAGSTGGGIKVSRLLILFKSIKKEIISCIHPNATRKITINSRLIESGVVRRVNVFMVVYVLIFAVSTLIVSIDNFDFTTNFTAVCATINNIGPGLSMVGPTRNFSAFSSLSKLVLCADMIIGRLEIFPFLLLFSPTAWRK